MIYCIYNFYLLSLAFTLVQVTCYKYSSNSTVAASLLLLLLPPERAREIEKYGTLCGGSVTCTSSYVRFKDKGRVLYALYTYVVKGATCRPREDTSSVVQPDTVHWK